MTILDCEVDLHANKYRLFQCHYVLFAVFVVSAILDAASTTHFMRILGTWAELNPFARVLSDLCGVVAGPIIAKALQVLAFWLITIVTPRLIRFVGCSLIVLNLYAAWYNFGVN